MVNKLYDSNSLKYLSTFWKQHNTISKKILYFIVKNRYSYNYRMRVFDYLCQNWNYAKQKIEEKNLLVSGWRIPFGLWVCCDKSTGTCSGADVPGTPHCPPLVSPPPGPPPGGPPYDNGWPPVFKPSDKPS